MDIKKLLVRPSVLHLTEWKNTRIAGSSRGRRGRTNKQTENPPQKNFIKLNQLMINDTIYQTAVSTMG